MGRVTDIERWPECTQSVTNVERLSPPPFKVGCRARVEKPRLPDTVWTVTALESPTGFTWESGPCGALAPVVWLSSKPMMRRYLDYERRVVKARSEMTTGHQPRIVAAAGQ